MKSYVASHLKDMNRKTVYQLISSVGEISKAEISRQTGISAPTVLKIIDYFLENNFVYEAGEGDSPLGRKPQILKFNQEAAFSIGVEMEGDFIKLGIIDLLGNIKLCRRFRVSPDFSEIVNNKLGHYIENIIEESGTEKGKILGIGLGIPGVVDPENYIVEFAPLVGIASKKDCKDIIGNLKGTLSLPVFIENDANAAAIGEFVERKLDADSDLVYVSLGTGLGSGIILNGKLRRGKRNTAGEIGYMVFDKEFRTSRSEAGWMESRINFHALSQRWERFSTLESEESIMNIRKSKDFYLLVDYIASNIALSIANISNLLDINLIVIGGISAEVLGDPLIESLNEYLSRLCLLDVQCEFQKCPEPGIVGAASIVTNKRLNEMLID